MTYHLTYRRSFKKELKKVSAVARKAIVKRVLALAVEPRPHGCTKLEGSDNIYRIRQGNYRVIYTTYEDVLVVELVKVGHRSDAYRKH